MNSITLIDVRLCRFFSFLLCQFRLFFQRIHSVYLSCHINWLRLFMTFLYCSFNVCEIWAIPICIFNGYFVYSILVSSNLRFTDFVDLFKEPDFSFSFLYCLFGILLIPAVTSIIFLLLTLDVFRSSFSSLLDRTLGH